jgi:hypothetical protein
MKLSKTMQKVMDQLDNAEHYYKVIGEENKRITFHNDKGRLSIGFAPTWIYYDGMFGIKNNTKTLEALEKRGLIKIHKIGGHLSDIVEVIGKEVHEPLTKAVKINVNKKFKDIPNSEQNLIEYYDPTTTTIEEIEKIYNEQLPGAHHTVTEIGEVELTRWDYREHKN